MVTGGVPVGDGAPAPGFVPQTWFPLACRRGARGRSPWPPVFPRGRSARAAGLAPRAQGRRRLVSRALGPVWSPQPPVNHRARPGPQTAPVGVGRGPRRPRVRDPETRPSARSPALRAGQGQPGAGCRFSRHCPPPPACPQLPPRAPERAGRRRAPTPHGLRPRAGRRGLRFRGPHEGVRAGPLAGAPSRVRPASTGLGVRPAAPVPERGVRGGGPPRALRLLR